MTLVGTVKQNKPESAALFPDGKQSLIFYHCCTSDPTRYHMYQQETRLSSSFHDSIMMTCAWVRHKTTNLKLSCTIKTTENGVDILDKLVRENT